LTSSRAYIELVDHIWNFEFDHKASKRGKKKVAQNKTCVFFVIVFVMTAINFFLFYAWIMYEFLIESCILRYLNDVWIFIWTMYFKVFEVWTIYIKKIPYDFTIRFYDPSLICIFRAVSKMCFWQPWLGGFLAFFGSLINWIWLVEY